LHRYIKGARSERELVRAAGSGVNALGPDIIAMKKGICLSFECKAWDRGSLSLEPDQYEKLVEWEGNTDGHTFVAWRIKSRGWLFIRLDEFTKGERNYNVTMKHAIEINRDIDSILALSPAQAAHPEAHAAVDATVPQASA
jgi:Holliday junction resolvase